MFEYAAGKASRSQRDTLKAVVSDAVVPFVPAVLEEEDPMPLYALKLLVVLLDTHPTWARDLQRSAFIAARHSHSKESEALDSHHAGQIAVLPGLSLKLHQC